MLFVLKSITNESKCYSKRSIRKIRACLSKTENTRLQSLKYSSIKTETVDLSQKWIDHAYDLILCASFLAGANGYYQNAHIWVR